MHFPVCLGAFQKKLGAFLIFVVHFGRKLGALTEIVVHFRKTVLDETSGVHLSLDMELVFCYLIFTNWSILTKR